MPQHFAQDTAVAAADDQDLLRLAVGEQRHVGHHLVIDELIPRGELDDAVQHHHPAEILILEDYQLLVFGLAIEEDFVRLQADAEAIVERLFDPPVHR